MILIKSGVDLAGLHPEMLIALRVAEEAYRFSGHIDVTITSARDSVHSAGSKHYVGYALDLRTTAAGVTREQVLAIVTRMRTALGPQFDVLAEVDHIHVEFDPKVGAL